MKIQKQPMGNYQTNCYIVTIDDKDIIIDAGVGAFEWIKKNVKNPIALLNTHGHFDHIWSNYEIKDYYKIPIYCPKDDAFMLETDSFNQGMPLSKADIVIDGDETILIQDIEVKFRHFAGHTKGCSTIEIYGAMFSGDFIFKNSIGRYDFPYSDKNDMLNSLKKFSKINYDAIVYTGHGENTTIINEQNNMSFWIRELS